MCGRGREGEKEGGQGREGGREGGRETRTRARAHTHEILFDYIKTNVAYTTPPNPAYPQK